MFELTVLFLCCFQSKSANVLAVLGAVASEALDLTGFYYSGKPITVKRRATQLSRTSTGRYDISLLITSYFSNYAVYLQNGTLHCTT